VPGFDPASAKLTVNRWIAAAANAAGERVAAAIEEYKFNEAADALYQFTWGNFCDWYIEFSKPILTGSDEAAKAETRAMTIWVIERVVHLLHPLMPYITETLWKHIAGDDAGMLITAKWPEPNIAADQAAVAEMEWVVSLISAIRATRSEMNVPAASELDATITEIRPEARGWIATHGEQIRRLARLKTIALGARADAKTALQVVVEGTTVLIDVAGAVDLAKERARLQKEAASTRGELDKIAKKLGNEQFMAKAKPEAIDEQRERQGEYEATLAKLSAALARIGAA
jgi:valyl-tRNA synthetase